LIIPGHPLNPDFKIAANYNKGKILKNGQLLFDGTIFVHIYLVICIMTKLLITLLTFVLLLLSCERGELHEDPDYPSTYYKIDESDLSQMKSSLASNYEYIKSTINDFGFCYLGENYTITQPPEIPYLLTEADAIQLASKFISEHPIETGIENPENVKISKSYTFPGGTHWTIVSSLQKIDNTEVLYTEIIIKIISGELVSCEGNWFPNIYIPSKFNFSESQAKNHIIGRQVTHYGMGGEEYFETITGSAIESSTADIKILPVKSKEKIELRVTWMIYISDVSCRVYVDVMTGEIVKQSSSLIS